MNIQKFRNSFRIYIVDSQSDRSRSVGDILSAINYRVIEYESLDLAIISMPNDPPHFVVLGGELVAPAEVKQILDLCPETHIIALVDQGRVQNYYSLLSKGLYDIMGWPLHEVHQLVTAIDRGAERDYFMYMSEQTNKMLEGLQDQVEEIQTSTTLSCAAETYLQAVHSRIEHPVCFFKYLPARQSLFLAHASGLDLNAYRGLGIDFSKGKAEFQASQLRDPSSIQEFSELIQTAFKVEKFCALPIDDGDGVKAIVVFLQSNLGKQETPIGVLNSVLRSRYNFLRLQSRLHHLESLDPTTQVWNRENFETKINEEISRSRRTHLPLAMIIMGVDKYDKIRSDADRESIDMMMRSLAGMICKNSRVNDIVGRINEDELALLLPHTGSRGAAIKAERLRRMVEAADFTKVFRRQQGITVSLGVSEYPSCCHDSEELVKSADDALFQIKETSSNKVCLAAIPKGFVADFEVGQE